MLAKGILSQLFIEIPYSCRKPQTNVTIGHFEQMHASSEMPEMTILIVNHQNISKLNNENFFKFGYIMGESCFLKIRKIKKWGHCVCL